MFDLAIVDQQLADMSGDDLASAIAKDRQLQALHILQLNAFGEDSQRASPRRPFPQQASMPVRIAESHRELLFSARIRTLLRAPRRGCDAHEPAQAVGLLDRSTPSGRKS